MRFSALAEEPIKEKINMVTRNQKIETTDPELELFKIALSFWRIPKHAYFNYPEARIEDQKALEEVCAKLRKLGIHIEFEIKT